MNERLSRDERDLLRRRLQRLLELLENEAVDPRLIVDWFFGPWEPYSRVTERLDRIERVLADLQGPRCALAQGERGEDVLRLVTGLLGRAKEDRKHISSWTHGATSLLIVDPYFFSFTKSNKVFRTRAQYSDSLQDLLPSKLETIDVFHLPGPNREILKSFRHQCKERNIALKTFATSEIHDRVLIKNGNEAIAIGTSFGGLSNKLAFVLDLPDDDLTVFRRELHRIRTHTQQFGES